MQSPPFPRYLVPPRSKYSPQHHILKHRQLPFLPQCQRPRFTPIHPLCGYEALINECVDKRVTAILLKEGISLNIITRLPSGRGIAGLFKYMWIIEIYAPSGAEKRQRETFFTHDLTCLLPTSPRDILLAGDFNVVPPRRAVLARLT